MKKKNASGGKYHKHAPNIANATTTMMACLDMRIMAKGCPVGIRETEICMAEANTRSFAFPTRSLSHVET
jgi:hypothetical protein